MRYLTIGEVVALHQAIIESSGAAPAFAIWGRWNQPWLSPRPRSEVRISIRASSTRPALGFGLALNHPFIDGNKRIAHAAMAVFLDLNGHTIEPTVDEQERLMLDLAAGQLRREELTAWLGAHVARTP